MLVVISVCWNCVIQSWSGGHEYALMWMHICGHEIKIHDIFLEERLISNDKADS